MMRGLGLCLVSILLIYACSESHFYSEGKIIANAEWSYSDTLTYQVDIVDTTARYDIGLDVEHSTEFEFQNLYIRIHTRFPDGETVSQTLPIDFADHTGLWYGDCSGRHCKLRVQLQQNARFDRIGQHTFEFIQYMREDPTHGVESITFFLDVKN